MNEDRIELETKYTFLEQTVSELNEVVYAQQKQIDLLEGAVRRLSARMEEFITGEAPAMRERPPPHF